MDHFPPSRGRQILGSVVRLLRPFLVDQLDAPPVEHLQPVVRPGDDDERRLARVRLEAERDSQAWPCTMLTTFALSRAKAFSLRS
jgi:hypothetical protein